MTQKEKELLLKDLCARLPYNPRIWITKHLTNIELTPESEVYQYIMCEDCKPYLCPMASMTEEEKDAYDTLTMCNAPWVVVDWLNAHHFDFRNLIGKGLALEAPKGMYEIPN